jgi:heptosyltransferase-2
MRLVVKEVNWLGDLVMSLPALRMIRSAFSEANLSVLIRQDLAGFFDGIDWIDEVIPYSMRRGIWSLTDQLEIITQLRARSFDLAIIFPNSFRSALWMKLAGVSCRAGYATDGRRLLLTHRAIPNPAGQEMHQRFYWMQLLHDALGIPAPTTDPALERLEVSASSIDRMSKFLGEKRRNAQAPLIALAPTAAYGPAKEWPPHYYAELIDLLDTSVGAECVLLGTASDRPRCEQVAQISKTGAIVAAGETDVGELKALLHLCAAFAGNDSGAMHLAAAIGIPSIGIFGSTDPRRTGPVGQRTTVIYHPISCSPCLKRTCRFSHYQCLRGVQPAEVARLVIQIGGFSTS